MNAARAQWFDLATTDAALLNIALSHSAANLALLEGRGDPHESLALRTEAIRIINKRINECHGGKLDDFTIGAVASLAGYEVIVSKIEVPLIDTGLQADDMLGHERFLKQRPGTYRWT